jgi:hypothetical protein
MLTQTAITPLPKKSCGKLEKKTADFAMQIVSNKLHPKHLWDVLFFPHYIDLSFARKTCSENNSPLIMFATA